ncbi:MAG TPA: twin-arginine translocase TatA/TatE family subunit [Solirubrobacteraceae bacterium]|jgi:sec-independent protein translocase protein TatA|nr:twin-arginine translocase TatA/TatE family subunit [Solirubrobacteraceae bacterium]
MLSGLENPTHLLLVFLVVLLIFGAKRLPEIGRGLGSGIHDFKKALTSPEEAAPEEEHEVSGLSARAGVVPEHSPAPVRHHPASRPEEQPAR